MDIAQTNSYESSFPLPSMSKCSNSYNVGKENMRGSYNFDFAVGTLKELLEGGCIEGEIIACIFKALSK